MIRVLHVLGELHASGAEVMLRIAGRMWQEHGVKCDVLSIGAQEGSFASDLRGEGYEVLHLPFDRQPHFLIQLGRIVRRGSYDVVHVHTERASVYLGVASRLAGAVVIRTAHSSFPFVGNLARRRTLQRRVSRILGTTTIAISKSVASNELERFSNPTVLVDNWIDVGRFQPPTSEARCLARARLGVDAGEFVVATVGNCASVKNHTALISALAAFGDVAWVWLHVGKEAPDFGERRSAAELGIVDRCRFLGHSDPLEALHAADLFVVPSLYEGLGLATVEALSTGLPVVISDVPGNRDLRGLGHRMIWTGTSAEELLAGLRSAHEALERLDDTRTRAQQGEAIASRFSPDRGVQAYAHLYALKVGA